MCTITSLRTRKVQVTGSSSGTTSTWGTSTLVTKVNLVIFISKHIMKHNFSKDFEEQYEAASSCLRTVFAQRKINFVVLKSFLKIIVHLNTGKKPIVKQKDNCWKIAMSNLCSQCSLTCVRVLILQTRRPKAVPDTVRVLFPSWGNRSLEGDGTHLSCSGT